MTTIAEKMTRSLTLLFLAAAQCRTDPLYLHQQSVFKSCCVIKKKKNPIKNNFNYANIHQRNRIKNDMLYYKAVVLSLTPLLFYLPSQVVNGN